MDTYIKSIKWSAPSNIALVKYWGKKSGQIPCNPSISFTLQEAKTLMDFSWQEKNQEQEAKSSEISLDFYFENQKNQKFEKRIADYLQSLLPEWKTLAKYHLVMKAHNTFAHSAGIASSASSMAALGLHLACLKEWEKNPTDNIDGSAFLKRPDFLAQASDLARRASGSACRSLFSQCALWGELGDVAGSDWRRAIPLEINPLFKNYGDAILMVDSSPKEVSSSQGHKLMHDHPYKDVRYAYATQNCQGMQKILKNGDQEHFREIVESEALGLHALMMSGRQSYFLLHPNTLEIISRLKKFRKERHLSWSFTLDAGPNIHLLYPLDDKKLLVAFIQEDLADVLENKAWLDDRIGLGPEFLRPTLHD